MGRWKDAAVARRYAELTGGIDPPATEGNDMTDILETLDDAVRRGVEKKRKQAREHPSHLIALALVTQWVDVWLLRRIAGKLGLPLTHLQAYLLVGIFGRDPGYPLNLIWQEKPAVKQLVNEAKGGTTAPFPAFRSDPLDHP